MRLSSVTSHLGKKGPHAQSAKAPDEAARARTKARASVVFGIMARGCLRSGSRDRRAVVHRWEPAPLVRRSAQLGIAAAAHEALVEAVGGLGVQILEPRARHGQHAGLLVRLVGQQRGGLPDEVRAAVAVVEGRRIPGGAAAGPGQLARRGREEGVLRGVLPALDRGSSLQGAAAEGPVRIELGAQDLQTLVPGPAGGLEQRLRPLGGGPASIPPSAEGRRKPCHGLLFSFVGEVGRRLLVAAGAGQAAGQEVAEPLAVLLEGWGTVRPALPGLHVRPQLAEREDPLRHPGGVRPGIGAGHGLQGRDVLALGDRKSTRLNSSHANISYAVFCLKKKTITLFPSSSPVVVERDDRKSTRLNSSHANISYAVFCLKKKTHNQKYTRLILKTYLLFFFFILNRDPHFFPLLPPHRFPDYSFFSLLFPFLF